MNKFKIDKQEFKKLFVEKIVQKEKTGNEIKNMLKETLVNSILKASFDLIN